MSFQDEGDCVFLTFNRSDFAAGKSSQFHSDLLSDLSLKSKAAGEARLMCSLEDFAKTFVSPTTIASEEFQKMLEEEPAVWEGLSAQVHAAIDGLALQRSNLNDLDLRELDLPRTTMDAVIEEAWITLPQLVTYIGFGLIQVLDEERLLLDLDAQLECTIEVQVDVELEPEPWADLPRRRETHYPSVSKTLTVGLETMLHRPSREFADTSVYHVSL